MSFLEKFNKEMSPKLARRANTSREIIQLLNEKKNVTIVETGTIRQENNWEWDGQSTLIWDAYVQYNGGRVFSVDIDPKAVELAQRSVSKQTTVTCGDSIKFLRDFPDKNEIDLLYLDTVDAHLPEAGKHHLFEFIQVWSSLKKGCIIAIDDVLDANQGKHVLIAHFMSEMGYYPSVFGYQIAWVK